MNFIFAPYILQGNIQKRHKVNWLDVGLVRQMKILNSLQGFMHIYLIHGA